MKTWSHCITRAAWLPAPLLLTVCLSLAGLGCASVAKEEIKPPTGPQIGEVVLSDYRFKPSTPGWIQVHVSDTNALVSEVKLQFIYIPLSIPMKKTGAYTWQADVSPELIRALSVSGQTLLYEARVLAANDQGRLGVLDKPIEIRINRSS